MASFIGHIVSAAFAVAVWSAILVSCTKADPRVESGRLIPHLTTKTHCSYMFSDGSIAEYERHGRCPDRMVDELEAE